MSDLISQVENKPDHLLGEEMLKKLFLKKEPFYGEPNTSFEIEAWIAHYHLLQHLILYNNVLMVMTAKEGTGKTTFANQFPLYLSDQFVAHKVTATEHLSAKALQRYLVQLFSLNSVGMDMNDTVGGYLSQLKERKQHCVLIIDDAHLLSDEILQMLFYYISRQSEMAYLHFLLVGDTELIAYIEDQLGENHDSVQFFELPKISLNETTKYLASRLSSAGYSGPPLFDKNTLFSIHQEADGDFRQILVFATRALIALNKANRMKKVSFWRRYVATGVVSSLVVVFSFLVSPLFTTHSLKTKTIALPKKRILSTDLAAKSPKPEVSFEPIVELREERATRSKHVAKVAKKRKVSKSTMMKQSKKDTLFGKKLASIQGPSLEKQLEAIKADRQERQARRHVVLDSVVVIPNPLEGIHSNPEPVTAVADVKKTAFKNKQKVKQPIVAGKNTAPHYVIQLLASTEREAVKQYAKKQKLPKDAKLYKTRVKNRDWYTVVIGRYSTSHQAKKALKNLPKQLAKLSPWVRSTKGLVIQQDVS